VAEASELFAEVEAEAEEEEATAQPYALLMERRSCPARMVESVAAVQMVYVMLQCGSGSGSGKQIKFKPWSKNPFFNW